MSNLFTGCHLISGAILSSWLLFLDRFLLVIDILEGALLCKGRNNEGICFRFLLGI